MGARYVCSHWCNKWLGQWAEVPLAKETTWFSSSTSTKGQAYDVCRSLMIWHTGKGCHVGLENYCTSVPLCTDLPAKGTYCAGTIHRAGLPKGLNQEIGKGKRFSMKSHLFACFLFHDRRSIRSLTTLSTAKVEEITPQSGETFKRPFVTSPYNSTMCGVHRKNVQNVVFHWFDRIAINSYLMYAAQNAQNVTRYKFMI